MNEGTQILARNPVKFKAKTDGRLATRTLSRANGGSFIRLTNGIMGSQIVLTDQGFIAEPE